MTARWVAFLTWAAVASGAVYWALRLAASPQGMPAYAQVVSTSARPSGDLQRVLGAGAPAPSSAQVAAPAAPAVDPRFTLVGVVAPRPGTPAREGVALIAADEQPAKAFRVGSVVEAPLVLLSVSPRGANLGPRGGPPSVVLELPEVPAAATGVPGAADDPAAPPPMAGMPVAPAPGRVPPAGALPRAPAAAPVPSARPTLPIPAVVPGAPPPVNAAPQGGPPPARTP